MNIAKRLVGNRLLRRSLMPLFHRLNPGDITVRHHHTGAPLRLHSFKHRGYWFHGRRREKRTMAIFERLIRDGDVIFDVGGHIGYMSLFFSKLVRGGRVFVFEPGSNNWPYLEHNLREHENVTLVKKGCGKVAEQRTLYLDDLSGQNNSLVEDFHMFEANKKAAFFEQEFRTATIDIIRLDDFAEAKDVRPSWIKIDIEGFEYEAIGGAARLLREAQPPRLMVEIQRNRQAVFAELEGCGYVGFNDSLMVIEESTQIRLNTFFLHREVHANDLKRLGLET